jgi:hypothetical protein
MPSYIHDNQKFSVVSLKDGRVMEIRRGSMTFGNSNRDQRQYWDSVDAWTATWPTDSTPCDSSTPAPASVFTSPSDRKQYLQLLEARLNLWCSC